jgi:hypothetical protein
MKHCTAAMICAYILYIAWDEYATMQGSDRTAAVSGEENYKPHVASQMATVRSSRPATVYSAIEQPVDKLAGQTDVIG